MTLATVCSKKKKHVQNRNNTWNPRLTYFYIFIQMCNVYFTVVFTKLVIERGKIIRKVNMSMSIGLIHTFSALSWAGAG